jgi:hypothetical protein
MFECLKPFNSGFLSDLSSSYSSHLPFWYRRANLERESRGQLSPQECKAQNTRNKHIESHVDLARTMPVASEDSTASLPSETDPEGHHQIMVIKSLLQSILQSHFVEWIMRRHPHPPRCSG